MRHNLRTTPMCCEKKQSRGHRYLLLILATTMCVALAISETSFAATRTWNGDTNNTFGNSNNWAGSAPGANDQAQFINVGGGGSNSTTPIFTSNASVGRIWIDTNSTTSYTFSNSGGDAYIKGGLGSGVAEDYTLRDLSSVNQTFTGRIRLNKSGNATIQKSGTGLLKLDTVLKADTGSITWEGNGEGELRFLYKREGRDSVNFVKDGGGKVTITGFYTTFTDSGTNVSGLTGITTINAGTVRITSGDARSLGRAAVNRANWLTLDGGALQVSTLDLDLGVNSKEGISLGASGGTLNVDSGLELTVGGAGGVNRISGAGTLTKSGDGTLILAGANIHSDATNINAGTLLLNGTHTGTIGDYTVASGATLGGSGSTDALIKGAGLVSPGNSPGILTVDQTDPSGGLDYAFEFTATGDPSWNNEVSSTNDVFRLKNATTPFTGGPLDGDNVIDIYLGVASASLGDVFRGGFFTDLDSDFLATVAGADYNYWVLGDGFGSDTTFGTQGYYSFSSLYASSGVKVSTFQVSAANFSGGTINNGWVMEFTIVPEPSAIVLLAIGLIGLAFVLRQRRRRRG